MKTDLFHPWNHCWVFQICWHIKCSTFTASSFRIWNSSTGITSLPLALFIVMLPKAHLTLHSRMSGSRWGITPSYYLGHEDLFSIVLCILAKYPLPLLGPYHFVLYCAHLCMKYSLGVSNVFEEISHLSHSIAFLCFFALITEEGFSYLSLLFFGTLHSNGYIFPSLLCLYLLFFSQLFVRPPQTTILPFAFPFLGDGLDQCLLYTVMNLNP